MEHSLCLLVIIGVFVSLGEAGPGRGYGYGHHWGMPRPTIPEGIQQMCGPTTSWDLASEVFRAFTKATEFGLAGRNKAGGYDLAPFTSTARAIMNLQISTDAEWYSEQPDEQPMYYYHGRFGRFYAQQAAREDAEVKVAVRQLEVEVLTFLTRYLNGEDSQQLMGDTEFASNLVALGLTCHNIFDFFGHNLYDVMYDRLRKFGDGVTVGAPLSGPATGASCDTIVPGGSVNNQFFYGFGLLVACQNAQVINPDFFRCAIEAQNNGLYSVPLFIPGLGQYPLGYGDLQLLGMACVKDKVPSQYQNQWSAIMAEISQWMINMQVVDDGSFASNPIATILAVQSLKSAEASYDAWNCEAAVRNMLALQDNEGKVAQSLGLTLLALPTLSGQSMANLDEIKPKCDNA